jgi:tetratricopeptide (TPR) repeat protein
MGRKSESINHGLRAIELVPGEVGYWVSCGFHMIEAGDLFDARALFERSLLTAGEGPMLNNALSIAYRHLGDLDNSLIYLQRALSEKPSFAPWQEDLKSLESAINSRTAAQEIIAANKSI